MTPFFTDVLAMTVCIQYQNTKEREHTLHVHKVFRAFHCAQTGLQHPQRSRFQLLIFYILPPYTRFISLLSSLLRLYTCFVLLPTRFEPIPSGSEADYSGSEEREGRLQGKGGGEVQSTNYTSQISLSLLSSLPTFSQKGLMCFIKTI